MKKKHLELIKNRYKINSTSDINLTADELFENYCKDVFNAEDFKKKVVLEIGGGYSNYVDLFFKFGAKKVYANELMKDRFNNKYLNNKNYIRLHGDFLKIDINEKVDVIFTSLTLMFLVPFHEQIFEKMDKVLNKGGLVIFFEPNYLSPISFFRRFLDFKPNPAKLFTFLSLLKFFKSRGYSVLINKPHIKPKFKFLNSWLISTNFWFKAKK